MQIIDKTLATIKADNFPKFLIIHHTGGENGVDTSNQTFEIVKAYHINTNKWETIGYHYFIDKWGKITQGRKDNYHGAHTKELEMNVKSLGICLAGNFDVTLPTQVQMDALKWLLETKMKQYGINVSNIFPHRHFALTNGIPYKSCFGNKLSDTWARDLITVIPGAVDNSVEKAEIISILQGVIERVKKL